MLLALTFLAVSSASAVAAEVQQDPADVRQYWTDQRMENAIPGSNLLRDTELPLLESPLGLRAGSAAPQPRSSAHEISAPDRRPTRTHGKVYFTLGGIQYVCSGTVVRAENKSVVVSAGHCVFGNGSFATNWLFVPAKSGQSEPYGRWAAIELAVPNQWEASEDIRYDVGMATLERRARKPIQRVLGARKIAFNQGRDMIFKAFGYPAEAPFDGQHLQRCKSPAEGTDNGGHPRPTRIDCDMTGGSSGGGWVIRGGFVNSVVSYGYESLCPIPPLICQPNPEEGKLFGPYFGGVIKRLYLATQARG